MASYVPNRHATRSWPKTLGNRLYGSLSALLGIRRPPSRSGVKTGIEFDGQRRIIGCSGPRRAVEAMLALRACGLRAVKAVNRRSRVLRAFTARSPAYWVTSSPNLVRRMKSKVLQVRQDMSDIFYAFPEQHWRLSLAAVLHKDRLHDPPKFVDAVLEQPVFA